MARNVNELSSNARNILSILIREINKGRIKPDDPRTFLGYKEIHDELNLTLMNTYGVSLSKQGLGELATWLHDNRLPAVTGLIIDKKKFVPGRSYYTAYGHPNEDFEWWLAEVRRSLEFDWGSFI